MELLTIDEAPLNLAELDQSELIGKITDKLRQTRCVSEVMEHENYLTATYKATNSRTKVEVRVNITVEICSHMGYGGYLSFSTDSFLGEEELELFLFPSDYDYQVSKIHLLAAQIAIIARKFA